MAAQRPDPATVGTTYMDIPSIAQEIRELSTQSSEGHVNGVWNSILNWVFDPVNGYITRPQDMHTRFGGRYGYSDFHTLQWRNGRRMHFLITQCKPRSAEGQRAIWQRGADQLQDYLRMQHRTRPVGQRTPVYGILAVGQLVRFFVYNDVHQSIEPFRPGALFSSTQERDFYYLIHEAHLVQRALRDILNNH
ncbi:hypothetical protein Plec18167_004101 [Paecilomyces lecythidis]|uniref:Uncharacterized protein n=1 Tax=Paecilomyces lecythidis TaxID=3004212 RepID=A0ABR3XUG9_9EURO